MKNRTQSRREAIEESLEGDLAVEELIEHIFLIAHTMYDDNEEWLKVELKKNNLTMADVNRYARAKYKKTRTGEK